MTQVVTKLNAKEAINGNHIAVLDFWATWCAPCRQLLPVINDLATEFEGRVFVGKVDAGTEEDLVEEFNVQSVPTVIFFKGGVEVERLNGAKPKNIYKEKIESLLG
ncbi:MAG: thioredoxin fold domain-containing protein [Paludibacteraceae bacterium]|nr:thioredoxin fold domain-containing protein [Paludibacteraceae bacterium]